MTVDLSSITILVPGKLHEHAVRRIGETFNMLRMDRIDPALITDAMKATVRGVAASPSLGDASVGAAFMAALPRLEIVANFGVGYDGVDSRHAGAHNVMVTNTPDVLTEEVADTAIGLLINAVRELPRAEAWLRSGDWARTGNYPLSRLSLRGRKAGILGMGRIGMAIAKRLEAFGLPVAYHNRRQVEGLPYPYFDTLKGLAEAVDTLISVVPGTPATAKVVNAEVLRALGPTGVFVNIGRGSTVDEVALAKALADGTIAAAGLDVFADEPNVPEALLDLPNASLLPHVGSASLKTREGMADLVVDNLVSWFAQGKPATAVPETAHVKAR